MRALILSILTALLAASPAAAQRFDDPDLGQRVMEGVADADSIWLRGATGKVVRFDRQTGQREVLSDHAVDLMVDGASVWMLTWEPGGFSYTLTDLRLAPDTPRHRNGEGDAIGLFPTGLELPGILTTERVVSEAPWRGHIAGAPRRYGHVTAARNGAVYIGYNRGEWGGGLRIIDPDNRSIAFVGSSEGTRCGGLLNPLCEPVVGAFNDPDSPDCVIVGGGLSHLSISFGRVYRVCGKDVSGVFETPRPATPDKWMFSTQTWPLSSLTQTEDGWVGVSRARYFRSRAGIVEEHPMPAFREWAGLQIGEEQDGVLMMVAACCWGSSLMELYDALAIPVLR